MRYKRVFVRYTSLVRFPYLVRHSGKRETPRGTVILIQIHHGIRNAFRGFVFRISSCINAKREKRTNGMAPYICMHRRAWSNSNGIFPAALFAGGRSSVWACPAALISNNDVMLTDLSRGQTRVNIGRSLPVCIEPRVRVSCSPSDRSPICLSRRLCGSPGSDVRQKSCIYENYQR